jgi:hypothetical protein
VNQGNPAARPGTVTSVTASAAAASPTDGRSDDRAAVPAGASVMADCTGWHTLEHGETGLHAVVEPGAPYHVRLGRDTDGYHQFMFCDEGFADTGDRKVSFMANGHHLHYLIPAGHNGQVSVTGTSSSGNWWYVCALDSTWAEIRWQPYKANGMYLGRNSAGYVSATDRTANGNVLWRIDQFADLRLPFCSNTGWW